MKNKTKCGYCHELSDRHGFVVLRKGRDWSDQKILLCTTCRYNLHGSYKYVHRQQLDS